MLPLVGFLLTLFISKYETALLSIALLTPFSIDFALGNSMQLSMPSEPLMILCTLIFLFRVLSGNNYDLRLLKHPVSILMLCTIGWMFVTSLMSVDTWVSLKYTIARIWFVTPCFYACSQVFKDKKRVRQFIWCYAISLSVVVLITTIKTLGHFHELQFLHRVMKPFYNDHTAYGCVIALILPMMGFYAFEKDSTWWKRTLSFVMMIILATGLALSYCRAAWVSLVIALGLLSIVKFRIKFKWIALAAVLLGGLGLIYQDEISYRMSKNEQDSSLDLAGQLQSISNVSTDASNLERLNRWSCAFRMFAKEPIMGFGPGTYQFNYASYQLSYMRTIISTDAGDLGNAHSEYIGPLAEQGVLGCLFMMALFAVTLFTGIKVYHRAKERSIANLALALTVCLSTYYVHGFFNNFLDTDKLSVPVWAFTAAIVALDVYAEKKTSSEG